MLETIEEARKEIDRIFVGLSPNTSRVKPVHLANGMFRVICNSVSDTATINRFVIFSKDSGEIPKGNDLESVYSFLEQEGRLDTDEVDRESLAKLRVLLKKLVNADGAVYLHKDNMESYSAASIAFLSQDRIAQDGGEFVAEWLRRSSSPLYECIKSTLGEPNDPITIVCGPLIDCNSTVYDSKFDYNQLKFFSTSLPAAPAELCKGLGRAASTLAKHISNHPNKLVRMRLAVLFASYVILRHLANLESYYVEGSRGVLPFFLDFSIKGSEAVTQGSLMTYTFVWQSIARFYGWAFGEYLRSRFSWEELKSESAPRYKKAERQKKPDPSDEMKEIWALALSEAERSENPFTVCGQALYDMLALEAQANPVVYWRDLGHRAGLLWPPTNVQPLKRFILKQDLLEVLVRGAVEPGEVIDLASLQDRFWKRYGLIIGGRFEDEERLIESGIYQADAKALTENKGGFAAQLSNLNFARLLADGVLQVELEGYNETRS